VQPAWENEIPALRQGFILPTSELPKPLIKKITILNRVRKDKPINSIVIDFIYRGVGRLLVILAPTKNPITNKMTIIMSPAVTVILGMYRTRFGSMRILI